MSTEHEVASVWLVECIVWRCRCCNTGAAGKCVQWTQPCFWAAHVVRQVLRGFDLC